MVPRKNVICQEVLLPERQVWTGDEEVKVVGSVESSDLVRRRSVLPHSFGHHNRRKDPFLLTVHYKKISIGKRSRSGRSRSFQIKEE